MTKEDILKNVPYIFEEDGHGGSRAYYLGIGGTDEKDIKQAMDEFAKQQAIAFAKFVVEKCLYREGSMWRTTENQFIKYFDDELYRLFLEHQSKQK